ncbi:MAG: DUF1073 domain-containing protein [Candidatus Arsenophonus phytopathogenicus]
MFAKFRKKLSPKMGDGGLDNLMRDVNAIGAATPTLPASFSTLGISGAGYFETDKGLEWLYERVSIVRKYINKTSGDCIKHWRTVRFTGDDDERTEQLNDLFTGEEKRLGIEKQAELALKLASLYGGSLLIAVTDEENLEKPLNVNKEQLKGFLVVRQGEYSIRKIATDIFSPYFNRPLLFQLKSAEKIPVHHSRCCLTVINQITNSTVKADKKANDGQSDILAFISDLLGYLYVNDEVLGMLREMKSDIFLLKDLNWNISGGRGKEIIDWLQLVLQAKKRHNVLMLDADSQYEQKELSLANVSDIWTKAQDRLAVAMDRPKTILFGDSAAGFSTGQEDLQSYYDTIFEIQESRLRPIINFFDKFICAKHGISETEVAFEFVQIKTENKAESATNLNTVTTALMLLLEHGVIEPQDALNELNRRELVDVKNVPEVTMLAKMLGEESDREFNTQRPINGEGM